MKLGPRILLHGAMAVVPLAVVGYVYAQLAGLWAASQSSRGDSQEQGAAITQALEWNLPLALALSGFLFVAVGEILRSLWRGARPIHQLENSTAK